MLCATSAGRVATCATALVASVLGACDGSLSMTSIDAGPAAPRVVNDAGTGDAGTDDTGTGDAGTGDTGTGDAGALAADGGSDAPPPPEPPVEPPPPGSGGPSGQAPPPCPRPDSALNLRPTPSTRQAPVGSVPGGVLVDVLARVEGEPIEGSALWLEIEWTGQRGFVSAFFAECTEEDH